MTDVKFLQRAYITTLK